MQESVEPSSGPETRWGRNILIILAVVAAVLLAANWAGGLVIAKRLDAYIQKRSGSLPFVLGYEGLSVNPLFGRATLSGVTVEMAEGGGALRFESLKAGAPFGAFISVMRDEEITSLDALRLRASGCLLDIPARPRAAKAREAAIGFSGRLDMKEPSALKDFPQHVYLTLSGLSINAPELALALNVGSAHADKLTTVDEFSLDMAYSPAQKELEVRNFVLRTPILEMGYSATFRFRLDADGEPEPSFISARETFRMTPDGMKLGIRELTGRYTLPEITGEAGYSVEIAPDRRISMQGRSDFSMSGLGMEFGGDALAGVQEAIGQPLVNGTFEIQSLQLKQRYEGPRFVLYDTSLSAEPYFKLAAEGEMDVGGALMNVPEVEIEFFRVTVTDISPEVLALIGQMEAREGLSLPRTGDGGVVFEMKGGVPPAGRLLIRGRDY